MSKLRIGVIVVLLAAILAGGAMLIIRHNTSGGTVEITLPTPSPVVEVYVSGAVANPGVYTIPAGSRVADAIEASGGITQRADQNSVNLARSLRDGDGIHVYTIGETSQLININTAGAWLLDALPGIGETIAQRIVDYRAENGPFQSIEDLKGVRGISDSTFDKIKDKVAVY